MVPGRLLFLLLTLFTTGTFVSSEVSDYCPLTQCGNITIEYPFYLIKNHDPANGTSQSHVCGYEGFGITCNTTFAGGNNSSTAFFTLPSDTYVVQSIDYRNNRLVLVDTEIRFDACPPPRNNVSVDGNTTLKLDPRNSNFTFLIDCPPNNHTNLKPVSCMKGSSPSLVSYAIPPGQDGASTFNSTPIGCKRAVVVPFMGVPKIVPGNFPTELRVGYVLDWSQPMLCARCEVSGGRCGYNSTKQLAGGTRSFVCYCKDGAHAGDCGSNSGKPNIRLKVLIGVSAAVFSFIVASLCSIYVHRYRERNKKRSPSADSLTRSIYSSKTLSSYDLESKSFHQRCGGRVVVFPYKELEEATDNFSPSNELGDGGFGAVYFGKLIDGREVAVKRLYENNYKRVEQFMNEIEILSGILHPNLVRLYGCTSRHSRELLLVYEYINNGTLGDHIHGLPATEGRLTWKVRLSIAVETAEALAYLHNLEPPIIHRDVKTNNILLDKDFHVKVADFGLSRLFPFDATHVSTAPQGTPGYVDPDYHKCYQLTDKSDVYSYGVVLAELISSFPAVDITRHRPEINLANMAMNKIHNHELHEFVDSSLGFETDEWVNTTVRAVAELAFRCLAPEREVRPTMDEVVESLRQTITSGGIESEERLSSPEIETQTSALLKSYSAMSPKAVTDKWPSYYSTPTNSG